MKAPKVVWIDERIAAGLPQEKDGELAARGVDQIRYVAQDRVNDLVRAAMGGEEFIVQISEAQGMLFGLSNLGRLWAFGNFLNDGDEGIEDMKADVWGLVAERELAP